MNPVLAVFAGAFILSKKVVPVAPKENATILRDDQHQCPMCDIVYTYSKAPGCGEKWEREQHETGTCSDACWEKFISPVKNMKQKT